MILRQPNHLTTFAYCLEPVWNSEQQSFWGIVTAGDKNVMAQFNYGTDLKGGEIRLLRLDWGSEDSDLHGTLQTFRLDVDQFELNQDNESVTVTRPVGEAPKAPDYEALSYPWGTKLREDGKILTKVEFPNEYKQIESIEDRPFNIKTNVESVLRFLRSQLTPRKPFRYIWIDALCINQNNDVEKSSQIPLMAEIYHRAQNVCVWLGEHDKERTSDVAIAFIQEVIDIDIFDELVADRFRRDQWDAFCKLLKRSWFSRRWIVQEIAVARNATIYCGTKQLEWRQFARAVSLFASRHESMRMLFKSSPEHHFHPNFLGDIEKLGASWLASTVNRLFHKAADGTILERRWSLEALMSNLTLFEAGDPRDYLYAILWLANDVRPTPNSQDHPRVHYSRPPSPVLSRTKFDSGTSGPIEVNEFKDMPTPPSDKESSTEMLVNGNAPIAIPTHNINQQFGPAKSSESRPRYEANLRADDALELGSSPRKSAMDSTLKAKNMLYTGPDLGIVIDYSKTVYEVCEDFMRHVFSKFGYIDMMCRPWAPNPTVEHDWRPPSWMVTLNDNAAFRLSHDRVYRRVRADPLVGAPHLGGRRTYNASGLSRAFVRENKQGNFSYPPNIGTKQNLFLKGFKLATILELGGHALNGYIPSDWLDLVDLNGGEQITEIPERFWRTLVADRGLDGLSDPPIYFEMACNSLYRRRSPGEGIDTKAELTEGKCSSHVAEFLRRVQSVVWHRQLVIAKSWDGDKEFLGLAPYHVREDDIVCILYGCSVPVILRSQSSLVKQRTRRERNKTLMTPAVRLNSTQDSPSDGLVEEWYELVGECYLDGMMHGEAFSHKKKYCGDGLDEMTFELR